MNGGRESRRLRPALGCSVIDDDDDDDGLGLPGGRFLIGMAGFSILRLAAFSLWHAGFI
jgi:hypothetical protein